MNKKSQNGIFVSVIVLTYNRTAFIGQVLDSVLAQDVPLRILVGNDCSQDDLGGFIARYKDCA